MQSPIRGGSSSPVAAQIGRASDLIPCTSNAQTTPCVVAHPAAVSAACSNKSHPASALSLRAAPSVTRLARRVIL